MNKEEFKTKMLDLSSKNNIMLLEEQIDKFYIYMQLLIEWNKKMNLTAIIEPNEIIEKHFIDSIKIYNYVNNKQKIIDVGTGAGFPGIPLAIINENIHITLLDSLNKRINFLNEVINKLDLKNVKAVHSRAEEYAVKNRECFDVAVSRAVANLTTLSEYLIPFVKLDGICVCMKGPNIDEELKNSKKVIDLLGGKIDRIDNFMLEGNMRNNIIIKKEKPTPNIFPRKPGKAKNEPII